MTEILTLYLRCSVINGVIVYFDTVEIKWADDPAYDLETIDADNILYIPENTTPYYGLELTEGTWPSLVEITGHWAYSITPPPDIELACLRLANWMFDMRDTSQGSAVVVTPEGRVLLPQGLPSDIVTFLAPYRRVRVAA